MDAKTELSDTQNDFSESVNKTLKQYHRWEDYNMEEDLVRNIYKIGFEKPSPIQKLAIKPILDGRDLRAQAQSGTGKTGAFSIAALQCVDRKNVNTQVLVLANTREVASQNADCFKGISEGTGINVCLLSGGSYTNTDVMNLKSNPHVIVGTPGRVKQMIENGCVKTEHIKLFILDEADEMLKTGFQDQVKAIFMTLNRTKVQIAMFSATFGEEELRISEEVLKDPIVIDVRHEQLMLDGIRQFYIDVGHSPQNRNDLYAKLATLVGLFRQYSFGQTIIFATSKAKAAYIYNGLLENKIPCDYISSDLTQVERVNVLNSFKRGNSRILVSSGLLNRGVDVQNLYVVFCLDLPPNGKIDNHIHRIGRSGRFGKKGMAINILFKDEVNELNRIMSEFGKPVVELSRKHLEQFETDASS